MSFLNAIDTDTSEFGELYDELPLWSAPFGLWLLDRVPVNSQQTVLDLGAGTGFLSVELAERCGPRATIFAVDPWAAAMARLRRKVDQRGLKNVRILQQDAEAIDLPENSIDVIVSNLGVNNFDNPSKVMAICSRLAKPDASFLLTTNLVGHMAEFYDVFRAVLIRTGQREQVAALDAHINRRATIESVTRLLGDAGFETTDAKESAFALRFADGSALLRHFFIRLGFLPGWKAVVQPDREAATFEALEAELNAVAARRGELSLTVPMAGIVARKHV